MRRDVGAQGAPGSQRPVRDEQPREQRVLAIRGDVTRRNRSGKSRAEHAQDSSVRNGSPPFRRWGKGGPPAGPLASWSNSRPRHRWRSSGCSAHSYMSSAICRKAHAGYADAAPYRGRAYCGKAPAPARGSARSGTVQAVANEGCGQRSYRHSGSAMRWPPERVLHPAGMARSRPGYAGITAGQRHWAGRRRLYRQRPQRGARKPSLACASFGVC